MIGEALAAIEAKAPAAVVVPSLPPAGLTPARQLCMRLHARIPTLPLVAARLGDPESEVADRVALLETAGCSEVAASLAALKSALQRIVRAALPRRTGRRHSGAGGGQRPAEGANGRVQASRRHAALARRGLGRRRRQLLAVLGARDRRRALPVRRAAASASSSASRCPSTRTRSGTAISKAPSRASSTAIACTAPTSPSRAIASIRTSC